MTPANCAPGTWIALVAGAGFLFWIWLLSIYPASSVASFSFLSPIFGILLGWLLLGEHAGVSIFAAGALVAAGILLINRPKPSRCSGAAEGALNDLFGFRRALQIGGVWLIREGAHQHVLRR